jgi:hypothetical protein
MSKKKFKETKVGQFLLQKIPSVVSAIAEDTPVGNIIEAIIGGSAMTPEDKNIALEKLKLERAEMDGITKRWVADSKSESWLSRNVRPCVLIFLCISYVIGWYNHLQLTEITSLMTIVIGGYFGSRGVEKVFGNNKHK